MDGFQDTEREERHGVDEWMREEDGEKLKDKKLVLAKKARRRDTNYIHAQLLLAGQKVDSDEIAGGLIYTISTGGCVRSYSVSIEFSASEGCFQPVRSIKV